MSKSRIMVVDDDDHVQNTRALLLRAAGYDVSLARHGFDALLQLKSHEVPNLIVSDLNMPEMSGIRQNISMRMGIRRFTRLTNAFSKRVENHAASVAIWFMDYNFVRVHQTLRVTTCNRAGISDHVWSIEEMCSLQPEAESAAKRADKNLLLKALAAE